MVLRARARSQARCRFIQYSGVVEKNRARRIAVSREGRLTFDQAFDPGSGNLKACREGDCAHLERAEIQLCQDFAGMGRVCHEAHVGPS
jgi:hypothetical protein